MTITRSTNSSAATSTLKKKLFFLVFFAASVTQGMYSTYFVSILTTIERIYQIQSKTAGAIMSATEIGQIVGALVIAYYGGKGNKPKWIAGCMTLMAIAALISTSPHFLLNKSTTTLTKIQETSIENSSSLLTNNISPSNLMNEPPPPSSSSSNEPSIMNATTPRYLSSLQEQLCYPINSEPTVMNSTLIQALTPFYTSIRQRPIGLILVIFFLSLLAIGFGSTAITTLGIPFIDDIVSKEESPLYLSLTIALKVFGPALGFLLGSFCIRLDDTLSTIPYSDSNIELNPDLVPVGAWWLGLIMISIPLMILAIPMYYLQVLTMSSKNSNGSLVSDFEDITYQAAEDHDIGGSRDFQTHMLTVCDLDVTSNKTCYSEVDSSSREVLQAKTSSGMHFKYNFGKNIILDRPIITRESIFSSNQAEDNKPLNRENWTTSCLVVNHFGGLESTSLTNDEAPYIKSSITSSSTTTTSSSLPPPPPSSLSSSSAKQSTMNLKNSLSRLLKNRLLLLRLLSAILHILPIAGFYTFLPKYLIEQYRIAPSSASAISGLAGILFVGIGAFFGGTIIRLFNINSKFMTRWIAISALLYAIGMLILMNLGCPQNHIVHADSSDYMLTDCVLNCKCSNKIYSPVCSNGTTYMSPCLAGCRSYSISENRIIFDGCGCSTTTWGEDLNISSTPSNLASSSGGTKVATQGHCTDYCDNLKWYIVIFSIFTFIHATCEVGSMMFNLRCVKSDDRTLALGLITFTSSLLGTIPCSVIYGTVIDLTCVHWDTLLSASQEQDQVPLELKGACRAYKNDTFRYYLHGFTAFVMFLAFIVDLIISMKAKDVDFYDGTKPVKNGKSNN